MSIAVGSNQHRATTELERQLLARRLAVHVSAAVRKSGCKCVLLTSPNRGDGKSAFIELLGAELEHFSQVPFRVLAADQLMQYDPDMMPEDRVVLVHGPAMLEGEEILNLRDDWIAAFDGAIVLVMGRKTHRRDLRRALDWLQAVGIEPIGLVYNEFMAPPLSARLAAFWRRMRASKAKKKATTSTRAVKQRSNP